VGVGFAVLETMGYGFTTLVRSHGDLPYVEAVLLIRGLASPGGHATWTGLAIALWRDAHRHWRPASWQPSPEHRCLIKFGNLATVPCDGLAGDEILAVWPVGFQKPVTSLTIRRGLRTMIETLCQLLEHRPQQHVTRRRHYA
jgi:hypothetical protein